MAGQKKPVGRPRKSGVRNNLTLRVRDEVRASLEEKAGQSGRSLSEEAETLLEQSLASQNLIDQALELEFGGYLAGLILILARVMRETGSHAGFAGTSTLEGAADWLGNPYAFDQVAAAANTVLEAFRPSGDIELPKFAKATGGPKELDFVAIYRDLGRAFAASALLAILGNERSAELSRWAARVREKLGPKAIEQVRQFADRGQNG